MIKGGDKESFPEFQTVMDEHVDQSNVEEHFPIGWYQDGSLARSFSSNFHEHIPVPCPHPDSSSSATFQTSSFPSWAAANQEPPGDRSVSISKSHSEAEKRRRDRINAQLGALRRLIPKADKMDKAALLASVIDRVKDLKRNASQICESVTVPTDTDEVTVECEYPESGNLPLIRATICCSDRPEVYPEIIRVLKGLQLRTVAADIASVGGRIKSILLLCSANDDRDHDALLNALKQALSFVLSRIAASSMPSNYRARSKRQRFFLPSHQSL